ncbi:MAG: hypothetical protein JNJ76_00545 [Candidatus Competibacter sp.]|nr:hypothetical protein [Candidatus Competibacter sp.]
MTYEGDLIRPLGLMVLYAAYAEGELDDLIESISTKEPYGDERRAWNVGKKLTLAQRLARAFTENDLSAVAKTVKAGAALFDKRNMLVHGRLFQGGKLLSNRRATPVQYISAEEITQLAEELWAWKEQLWLYRCKMVLPYKSEATESGT